MYYKWQTEDHGRKPQIQQNGEHIRSAYPSMAPASFRNYPCRFSEKSPPVSTMAPPWPIFDNAVDISKLLEIL